MSGYQIGSRNAVVSWRGLDPANIMSLRGAWPEEQIMCGSGTTLLLWKIWDKQFYLECAEIGATSIALGPRKQKTSVHCAFLFLGFLFTKGWRSDLYLVSLNIMVAPSFPAVLSVTFLARQCTLNLQQGKSMTLYNVNALLLVRSIRSAQRNP